MPLHFRQTPTTLTISCDSTLTEIRATIVAVDRFLHTAQAPSEWIEDMNIILAEVLSNIARHGYVEETGRIDLSIRLHMDELRCAICDTGRPFDPAKLGNSAPEPADLREGGYGWFLIRTLARELTYQRSTGANRLVFWVPVSDRQPCPELVH